MKSPYYVATVVNAYRRAIDTMIDCKKKGLPYKVDKSLLEELNKASHRDYTTGFMVDDGKIKQNLQSSSQEQEAKFIAVVLEAFDDKILIEQRNKFAVGETLEMLSPNLPVGQSFVVKQIVDEKGNNITEAKNVQQKLFIYGAPKGLTAGDILRKSI
jgi:putative protease